MRELILQKLDEMEQTEGIRIPFLLAELRAAAAAEQTREQPAARGDHILR